MSLDAVADATIRLICKNDPSFSVEVNRSYLLISGYISSALEQDPSATEFEVDLSSAVLAKIVQYVEYHKGVEPPIIEKPLRSRIMSEVVKHPFDAEFIDGIAEESQQLLYDVLMGALYFHIPSLLHLGCAKVAGLIKGHPLDKVKAILVPKSE